MFIHWVWFTIQMASITRRKQKLQNIRNFRFKKKLFHKETRGMVRQLLQVSGEDWVAAVKEYVDNNGWCRTVAELLTLETSMSTLHMVMLEDGLEMWWWWCNPLGERLDYYFYGAVHLTVFMNQVGVWWWVMAEMFPLETSMSTLHMVLLNFVRLYLKWKVLPIVCL
ncbi:hypothetical protein Hamer_G027094 [Homarus americanus]|uniref:Uncharacterized protein n=1 Tax=Homarus americanus TaxID=6706 RepID=A0A8J5K2E1_HOMAM|nr:hypothetical protein Hamer_G027094 [Homarus americanus]